MKVPAEIETVIASKRGLAKVVRYNPITKPIGPIALFTGKDNIIISISHLKVVTCIKAFGELLKQMKPSIKK